LGDGSGGRKRGNEVQVARLGYLGGQQRREDHHRERDAGRAKLASFRHRRDAETERIQLRERADDGQGAEAVTVRLHHREDGHARQARDRLPIAQQRAKIDVDPGARGDPVGGRLRGHSQSEEARQRRGTMQDESKRPKTEDGRPKGNAESATLDDALAIMRDLRERDVWDRAQTHDSLRPYLNEEMHELDDAIRSGDDAAMRSELGDVLLQVLFHAIIAEERGAFNVASVAGSLVTKMTKRHPWLYAQTADGGRQTAEREPWEQMKSKSRSSLADGLPQGLPALHRAHRLQERAAGVGFDWPDVRGPIDKVREELAEVEAV